jgi:hypothetical protein
MASRPARHKINTAAPELRSLNLDNRILPRLISGAISLALLAIIIWKMRDFGFAKALETLPEKPLFWIAFAAYYLALPVSEWLIFKWLWNIPAAGFAALLRKLVSNEVLFGYSGEVQFYAWARGHAEIVASPFGAIKDVSVLSAVAGNLATLAMLAVAWPMIGTVAPQFHAQAVFASASVIILMSMIIFLFKDRIFSLPSSTLRAIFAVHVARLLVTTWLSGVMWHVALPQVSLIWLILLATLQLLVTRLPLVPNKDMVFASLAIFLIGHDGEVGALITMIAAAILAVHLIIGGVLTIAAFIETPKS